VISLPIYRYKAVSATGENIAGTYNAKVKDEVINMLRENKYIPIEVNEVITGKEITFDFLNGVKTKDLAVFCRQFYAMLNAGVPIVNCLDILRQQTEHKKLRLAIGEIYEEVQKGQNLSDALRSHRDVFPDLFINMVEAGELSGKLDVIMDRMATNYEKENRINGKIQGAMIYPIVLAVVTVVVVTVLLVFVMPTFMDMFESTEMELPMVTKALIAVSNFIKRYWYFLLIAIGGGGFLLNRVLKTDSGKLWFDKLAFSLPVVKGSMQKIITSRFTRTLSTLLSSGIPLLQALDTVSRVVNNAVVEKGIQRAMEEVKKGSSLAGPIKEVGVFPPMIDAMIRIGEESGSLDEILEKTSVFYDDEVEAAMQKLTTLIEPLMIIIMALVVGFIVVAMILPMFKMTSSVQGL